MVPQKVRPDMTKPLPSVQPNVIEDDEGNCSTSFQHKVYMYLSGPIIINPDFPVPQPRIHTAQPPRVDTEGPSYNLISRGNKTPIPLFSLTAQFQKIHEANAVTTQISVVAKEYRHMIKVPDRKFWERSFATEPGQLFQGIIMVKGKNTVIFIPKAQVLKDKKVTYGKIVCILKPEKEEYR